MPELGAWLQRIQWIVVREHMEQLHRLRRFDARIQRQFFHELRQRGFAQRLHDETVDTERGHGPAVDDFEAVLVRKPFRNLPPRIASGAPVVAAGIVHVGAKVRCGQAQHDQDLSLEGIAIDYRLRTAIDLRAGNDPQAQECQDRQATCPHRAP